MQEFILKDKKHIPIRIDARYYEPEIGEFLREEPEPGRAGDALQRN